MTRYEDLSPYEYSPQSIPECVLALNVGWLGSESNFSPGEVSEEFLLTLGVLCRDKARMRARGWHRCQLSHQSGEAPYPLATKVPGSEIFLGGAEIRVVSFDGEWLIAPDLVHHYVTAHHYQPPGVFVEAVLARRVAP